MDGDSVGYAVGAGGLLLALGQAAWQRFFSAEGKANDALVQQLGERITAQETRMTNLEQGLDEERKLRREAESQVFALRLRVTQLETELRHHGIEVPT
ncbi:hypothetical protein [Lysobacter antibioticus]|uniref:hypothetical protein n=1 Tax=Lysobacter antibioticus TaxID=84531 RepID=UPI00034CCFED|nr:hypothetical protein [Lysobacter antibioticus]